jgi:hypothetical protein
MEMTNLGLNIGVLRREVASWQRCPLREVSLYLANWGHSICCHYPMCILSIKEMPPIADRLRNPTPYCRVKDENPVPFLIPQKVSIDA